MSPQGWIFHTIFHDHGQDRGPESHTSSVAEQREVLIQLLLDLANCLSIRHAAGKDGSYLLPHVFRVVTALQSLDSPAPPSCSPTSAQRSL